MEKILFIGKSNPTVVKEFTPTMLISAKCKVTNCTNKGDFRDMPNGVCDQCWQENEAWRTNDKWVWRNVIAAREEAVNQLRTKGEAVMRSPSFKSKL